MMYILGEHRSRSEIYLGRHFQTLTPRGYMSGGAGYLISKPAVRKLLDDGPKYPAHCPKDGNIEDLDTGRYR